MARSRLYKSLSVGALAVSVMSGCAAVPSDTDTQTDNDAQISRYEVEFGAPSVVALPAAPPTLEAAPAGMQAASPKLKPDPPPAPLESSRLIGLDENGAERLLGRPDYVISQQTAQRWRYIKEACILELFFYADLETNQLRVLAYDVATPRPAAGDDSLKRCAAAPSDG